MMVVFDAKKLKGLKLAHTNVKHFFASFPQPAHVQMRVIIFQISRKFPDSLDCPQLS